MSRLAQLVARFRSGSITRRVFFVRLASVLGSSALAQHYFELNATASPQNAPAGPEPVAVESSAVMVPGEAATLLGYFSRPLAREDAPSLPGLLLVHPDHGLDEQIREVARRLAAEGYFVLALDHLSRQGGTPVFTSPDDAAQAFGKVAEEDVIQELEAAASYLTFHPWIEQDRIGVIGFGWGGTHAFQYAAVNPTLQAAVVYCGAPPPEDSLAGIAAPVLGNYASNDTRVTPTIASATAAMQRLDKPFDAKIYPAEAAFFDPASSDYDEAAAQDSWARTLAFLHKHLAPNP